MMFLNVIVLNALWIFFIEVKKPSLYPFSDISLGLGIKIIESKSMPFIGNGSDDSQSQE